MGKNGVSDTKCRRRSRRAKPDEIERGQRGQEHTTLPNSMRQRLRSGAGAQERQEGRNTRHHQIKCVSVSGCRAKADAGKQAGRAKTTKSNA